MGVTSRSISRSPGRFLFDRTPHPLSRIRIPGEEFGGTSIVSTSPYGSVIALAQPSKASSAVTDSRISRLFLFRVKTGWGRILNVKTRAPGSSEARIRNLFLMPGGKTIRVSEPSYQRIITVPPWSARSNEMCTTLPPLPKISSRNSPILENKSSITAGIGSGLLMARS